MVGVGQRRVAVVTVCSLLLSPPIGIPAAALAAAAPAAAATGTGQRRRLAAQLPDSLRRRVRHLPTPGGELG